MKRPAPRYSPIWWVTIWLFTLMQASLCAAALVLGTSLLRGGGWHAVPGAWFYAAAVFNALSAARFLSQEL